MFKKVITYEDVEGNSKTKAFWFNLTEVELMQMKAGPTGGLAKMVERIIAEQDEAKIIEVIKDMILRSYGEKSTDGERFMKSPERAQAFAETDAFTVLFLELGNNAQAAVDFVRGIVPKKFADQMPTTPPSSLSTIN